MHDIIILCLLLAAAAAIGAIAARVFFPRQLARLTAEFDHISDEALARIAHEARRAYEQSLGIMRLKSWNNLTTENRVQLTAAAGHYRNSPNRLATRIASGAEPIFLSVIGLAAKP